MMRTVRFIRFITRAVKSRRTSIYELEVLAIIIIKALVKFLYLLRINFKIITDCRAFALTMNKRDLCVRVAHRALLLEEFDYVIEHRPGVHEACRRVKSFHSSVYAHR